MGKKKRSLAAQGDDIDEQFEQDEARRAKQSENRSKGLDNVFRFKVDTGKSAEIVFLDEDYKDGAAFHEHAIYNPQTKRTKFHGCCAEVATCAICENTESKESYVHYVSVLHLNAYQDKKTKEWKDSRALLGIKSISRPTFKKVMDAAMKKHGTLRGVTMLVERPAGAATNSARIGEPVEYDDTDLRYGFVKNLEKKYGHDEIVGKDGTTIYKQKNANITAFDYEELFPEVFDVDLMIANNNKEFGNGNDVAGSADETAKEWDEDDTTEEEAAAEPARKSRKKKKEKKEKKQKRSRSVTVDEEEDDDIPF